MLAVPEFTCGPAAIMGAALPKPSFDAVDESRIDATLRGMSLDEKLGQMWQVDWRTMRPRPRGCASVPWLGRLMEMVVNLLPGCLGLGLGLGLGFLLEDAPLLLALNSARFRISRLSAWAGGPNRRRRARRHHRQPARAAGARVRECCGGADGEGGSASATAAPVRARARVGRVRGGRVAG